MGISAGLVTFHPFNLIISREMVQLKVHSPQRKIHNATEEDFSEPVIFSLISSSSSGHIVNPMWPLCQIYFVLLLK